jgi:hypothetical protein
MFVLLSQPGQAKTKRLKLKGVSREAAKNAKKENLYVLVSNSNDLAFLGELGAFARKFLPVLRRI